MQEPSFLSIGSSSTQIASSSSVQLQQRQQGSLEELHKASPPLSSYMKPALSSAVNASVPSSDTSSTVKVGLKYGCPVEDVITGLSIQCNGWKSVYYNPKRKAFLGVAPTSLYPTLVQHKRWSEGDLQILLSKYSPASYGFGRISHGQIMGYCTTLSLPK